MWYRLDDVGDVVTGTTPSKSVAGYYGNDYPLYKPTDLEQGINTITSSDALSAEGYNEARQIPCDSILVTCIGATIGKTGLIRREGSCNQQINAIIPHHAIVPEYLYSCCISDYFQDEIHHRASATTLPILNKSKFSEILIPVPPINEQRRICERLSHYYDFISSIEEQDGAINSDIQLCKNKILDLAIHGKLVPQDSTDEPAIELLKRINPNFQPSDNLHYQGKLPNGWTCATFDDIFDTIPAKPHQVLMSEIKRSGTYPVISQGANYIDGYSDCVEKHLAVTNPIIIFGDHSKVLKYVDFDFIVGADGVKILVPRVLPQYAYYHLQQVVSQMDNRGYSRNFQYLSSNSFFVPPFKEQKRIVSAIEQILTALSAITK